MQCCSAQAAPRCHTKHQRSMAKCTTHSKTNNSLKSICWSGWNKSGLLCYCSLTITFMPIKLILSLGEQLYTVGNSSWVQQDHREQSIVARVTRKCRCINRELLLKWQGSSLSQQKVVELIEKSSTQQQNRVNVTRNVSVTTWSPCWYNNRCPIVRKWKFYC